MAVKTSAAHGGNVYAAARELRRPVRALVDFSASINPLGPSRAARRVLADNLSLIEHYPDPDSVSLRRSLAVDLRVSPDQIVIGNGSTELIHIIPRALHIRTALIVGPTFSEYAAAVRLAGGRSFTVVAAREENYRPPLEKVIERLRSKGAKRRPVDAVFLCQPNSPTGRLCEPRELLRLVRTAHRAGVWVILDETFGEYGDARSLRSLIPTSSRVVVLRSFTKFYALPGLRIGYAVSSPRVATLLREHQPTWSVNVMAQLAAEAALKDRRHAKRSLVYMKKERERLTKELSRLPGLTLFPSEANFLLLEFSSGRHKRAAVGRLRRRGMLVRDCASVPGLNPRTIRIAVRTRKDNDGLIAALRGERS